MSRNGRSSPLLLGFEEIERLIDRASKTAGDGYPPYNIERLQRNGSEPERLRITLAVAGFTREDLDVSFEDNQLVIRGKQKDDIERQYLHRGIAARQFQRAFVIADGIVVKVAELKDGLLSIDLEQPQPERVARRIEIAKGLRQGRRSENGKPNDEKSHLPERSGGSGRRPCGLYSRDRAGTGAGAAWRAGGAAVGLEVVLSLHG